LQNSKELNQDQENSEKLQPTTDFIKRKDKIRKSRNLGDFIFNNLTKFFASLLLLLVILMGFMMYLQALEQVPVQDAYPPVKSALDVLLHHDPV